MHLIKQALFGTLVATAASIAFADTPTVPAAPAAPATPVSPVAGGQSLAIYAHAAGPLRISGEAAVKSLTVPISPREQVRSALLHLVATNSVSLLPQRSQLAVRVDDRTIAQFPLSPLQPELAADIRIPANLLSAGYNNVSFAVAEHATNDCEERDAPELWTEIDTANSTLQIQTELKPLSQSTLTLSALNDLIDPRQSVLSPMTIVMAAHPLTDAQMATGGLLAQGMALRLRYLNANLHVQDAQAGTGVGILPGLSLAGVAGSDVVLVGSRDQLAKYLDAKTLSGIDGAFLGIYPKPDDPRHFVLIVSGRDEAEVSLASKTFAHAEMPLPNKQALIVRNLPDDAASYRLRNVAVSGTGAYAFRDLGFKSVTLGADESADLKVRLPGDLYAPEDAQVNLTLNFSEGAKMRSDSVLNVYLNGQFERTVALDQSQGAVVNHYQMPVPLRHFRPGDNVITLRPVMIPLITDRCTLRQSGNLQLSIFDNSTLRLPAVSHFASLPDLGRFAATGFPYVVSGSGAGLAVQVNAASNDTLAAAWSLLGKLAQNQGRPLTDAQVTGGAPANGRNTIVIGAQDTIPAAELSRAPWHPGVSITIPAGGMAADTASGHGSGGFWDSLFDRAETGHADASQGNTQGTLQLNSDFSLSHQLLVMQYQSENGTTTTVMTASTAADVATGVRKLIDAAYWSGLDGDVALLNFDDTSLWTTRVGPRYTVGRIDPMGRLGYAISTHPWWGYVSIVVSLLVLAALSSFLLRRYKRKHHGTSDE